MTFQSRSIRTGILHSIALAFWVMIGAPVFKTVVAEDRLPSLPFKIEAVEPFRIVEADEDSVVLTAEYMQGKKLPVKGILFNHFHRGDTMEEDNIAMCRQRTGLPVLACIPDGAQELPMEPTDLAALYEEVSLT